MEKYEVGKGQKQMLKIPTLAKNERMYFTNQSTVL
jgi:hypothetical protein